MGSVTTVIGPTMPAIIVDLLGEENVFRVTERLGESFLQAFEAAETWLAEQPPLAAEQEDN